MAKALSSTASDYIHDMSEKFSQSNWINPKAYAVPTSSGACATATAPAS